MTPFEIAAAAQQTTPTLVRYWAYHDEHGLVTHAGMSTEPDTPRSVEITRAQYDDIAPNRFKVKDGALVPFANHTKPVLNLRLDPAGEYATLPGNMLFASSDGDRYTAKRPYDD